MRRARHLLWVTLLMAATAGAQEHRGVALGLFSEDAGWSYAPLLDEIRGLGATDVELVVPLYQHDVEAAVIGYHPRYSPPLATVRRAVQAAHARGLAVLLFPIVRLEETHGPNEWRGTLRPPDRAAWLASYGKRLLELAALAQAEHVEMLSVGSELSTLDGDAAPWAALVQAVRARYEGQLTYSGNWDHFERVGVYALVDSVGVCAYFPLHDRAGGPLPSVAQLATAWQAPRARLAALSSKLGKRVLLTELGYRSQPNALVEPWDEGSAVVTDELALEAQRLGFAAFRAAFEQRPPWLLGFHVWNWYGWGGASSRAYTPRGKPAAREVESLLRR